MLSAQKRGLDGSGATSDRAVVCMDRLNGFAASLAIAMVAVFASGCGRIENPHPETAQRQGLLVANYWIENSWTNVEALQPGPAPSLPPSNAFAALELSVLSPENHLSKSAIDAFEEDSGAQIRVQSYDRISDLKGAAEEGHFDVLLVPGVVLQRLMEEGRLAKLDPKLIPNLANLESEFRTNAFDPFQVYSVPYLWSTAGIAFNFERLDFTPATWRHLVAPDSNYVEQLRRRVSLLPDIELALGPTLIDLGYPPYSSDPDEIQRAGLSLREQMDRLDLQFVQIPPATALLKEDLLMAECYAGDVAAAISHDPRILFVVPEDGTWIRIEFLAIRSGTDPRHLALAHSLIQFLLDPKVAGEVSTTSLQASTVRLARSFVGAWVKNGPAYATASNAHLARFDQQSDELRHAIWRQLTNAPGHPDSSGAKPAPRVDVVLDPNGE